MKKLVMVGRNCYRERRSSERRNTNEKELLRPKEAARILQVSRWTVYRWLAEGRIQGIKVGKGTLRIFQASVDRLIEDQSHFLLQRDGPDVRADHDL